MKVLNIHCSWSEVRFELDQAEAMGWRLMDRICLGASQGVRRLKGKYILIFVKG